MRKLVLIIAVFVTSLFSQELPPPVPAPVHITDDYGPRNLSGEYDWHGGIDYRASPGTAIRAVEGGEISVIDRGSRAGWYIRIHGAHAYWTYMHLFSDNSNPTSGNWEAIRDTLIDPNTGQPSPLAPEPIFIQWADRENRIAHNVLVNYDYRGRRIRHNGGYIIDQEDDDTMLTSGSVGGREIIGPSGHSGHVGFHLDIRCSSPTASVSAYDLNPLYHIIHDSSDYSLDILQPAADATFFHFPGEAEAQQGNERIQVQINSINGKDLDRACVYFFDPDSTRFYVDSTRYAMICYGGLPQNPDSTDADTTLPFPSGITSGDGRGRDWKSGVDPQGRDPSIDDFWYIGGFSQDTFHFNSRLNKAETGDALLNKWATSDMKKAKFKDGWTDMVIRARNVRGALVDSAERRILLDNFVPYVYAIMVTRSNEVVHNAMWLLNSTQDSLKFNEQISKNVLPGDTLKFKIYFSEIMDTTDIKVKLKKDGNELKIKDNKKWIDKMTWEGSVTIPEDDEDWKEGDAVVNISCKDLAGHMLDRNPGSIAYRKDKTHWEDYEDEDIGGSDENHELYIGEAPIVTSTDPSDRSKEVPVDKDTISIVFSKSMEQDITEEAFSIVSEKGDSLSFDFSWKDTITLEIAPSDTFDCCMEYTCTIKDTVMSKDSVKLDGNTDDDGEAGGDHIFTFITEPPDIRLDIYPLVENVEQGHPLSARLFAKGNGLKKEIDCNITYYLSDSKGWAVDGIDTETFSLSSTETHEDPFRIRNFGSASFLYLTTMIPLKCETFSRQGVYWSAEGHQHDHPDENQSPGKMEYPTPWITRTQPSPAKTQKLRADSILPVGLPDIGILLSGWADGYGHILGKYGISTLPVKPDLKILNKTPHTAYGIRLTA